jgi:hypothetical protein
MRIRMNDLKRNLVQAIYERDEALKKLANCRCEEGLSKPNRQSAVTLEQMIIAVQKKFPGCGATEVKGKNIMHDGIFLGYDWVEVYTSMTNIPQPHPPLTPSKEAKRIKRLGAVHLSAAPKSVVVVKPKEKPCSVNS